LKNYQKSKWVLKTLCCSHKKLKSHKLIIDKRSLLGKNMQGLNKNDKEQFIIADYWPAHP